MGFVSGKFDILSVQYGLSNGIRIKGALLHPEVFLYQVDEPDFGCEGRQQGDRAYAVLHGYTLTGPVKWLLSEETLLKCELFDQMWVGTLLGKDGTRKLVSYREGNETYTVLDRDKWEEKLPAQQ